MDDQNEADEMMAERKHFNLEEANTMIPHMEMAVEKMQRLCSRMREKVGLLAQEGHPAHAQLRPGLRPLFADMAQTVQSIEKQGGVFKGVALGLVDFPAVLNGEEVYLCWQYGEKEIAYYHKRTAGFSVRQPLEAQPRKLQYCQ